ncbi:MAG: DUF6666 family protein, partial [Thermoguttaceae bacterium]
MRRVNCTVAAMAWVTLLVVAVQGISAAPTAIGEVAPRTVWKARVPETTLSDAPRQRVEWSPYRTAGLHTEPDILSSASLSASIAAEEIPLPDPLAADESLPQVGPPVYGDGCDTCGPEMSRDSCSACAGGLGCDGRASCCNCGSFAAALARVVTNLNYFGGVHGFKGPTDLGRNGNFGFNYGMVWSSPLGDPWGIGYQTGVSVVSSNFTGDQVTDVFSGSHRDQVFFTSGLFRRPVCEGIQWGVVYDLMRDNYRDNATTGQIRTELALARPG